MLLKINDIIMVLEKVYLIQMKMNHRTGFIL